MIDPKRLFRERDCFVAIKVCKAGSGRFSFRDRFRVVEARFRRSTPAPTNKRFDPRVDEPPTERRGTSARA
jgi:hypothetical protein